MDVSHALTGQEVLERSDLRIDEAAAERVARERFGLTGRAVRLTGERDQNFRLETGDGPLLLKFSHSAEDAQIAEFQTRVMQHLGRAPEVATPRLRPGLDGEPGQSWRGPGGAAQTVRLLHFLPGEPLSDVSATRQLLERVGAALARLDRAMADFAHPADSHELLWDLARAGATRTLLPAISAPADRDLAEQGLDLFERVAPAVDGLRRQVIHNDLNPHNVLVDTDACEVTGLLDLGDAVRAPLVNDVAVAAAYQLGGDGDALDGPAALVLGYAQVLPLDEAEVEALPALIAGRLAMTLAITAWRAERHAENRVYILRNAPLARAGLARLLALPPGAAVERLRVAAGFGA